MHTNVHGKKLKLSLPTISEIVWQQPLDSTGRDPPYNNLTNDSNTQTTITTDSAQQTSPPYKMPKLSGISPECKKEKSGIKPGLCPESFQTTTNQADTLTETSQRNRDDITPTSLTVSSFICEHLVRDVESNQTYLPLNASVTLKQKKKMLYVPIDFSNGVTIDALVDSGAYVSAIPEDEMERIKTYSRGNILKMGDPPAFQIQVANGQLEKPTAIATMWFEIGDFEFAEHFVVMRNLTGPIIGLHFMRYNSVILDITHALLHFPHLSMQAKTTDGVKSTKPQAV